MSKAVYISDNNENRKCPTLYAVIGKENRKIKRGYVTVDNEWRMCYLSAWIWDVWNSVGTTTWNKYNSVETTTYYWNRYGITQEYGAWTLEFVENINEIWDDSTVYDTLFWNKLAVTEKSYDPVLGTMSIDTGATSATISQQGVNFGTNLIGQKAINGEREDVYGWVRGGVIKSESYKDYYNSSAYVDIISSVYYDSSAGGYRAIGQRFQKYWTRTSTDVVDRTKTYSDVSSSNRGAYPDDGKSGAYWYIYSSSALSYYKGSTSYGSVTSASSTTYPANGRYSPDGLWYVSQGTTYEKGDTYYGEAESENENAYPENGRHTDGRWYVRKP